MSGFERENPYGVNYPQPPADSWVQRTNLVARVGSFVSALVSLVLLQTAQVTLKDGLTLTFNFSSLFHSYRCIFYVSIFVLVYALFQIPCAVYCVRHNKRFINNSFLIQIDFYCDKIITLLLGVAVGAAFGGTMDLNATYQPCDEPKIHKFFGRSYVVAGFTLAGCLCSAISSIFSSWAVADSQAPGQVFV